MRRVAAVVAVGCIVFAAALGYTILQSPITVASTNTSALMQILSTRGYLHACQTGEILPRGTTAVRFSMFAGAGPRIGVEIREHGRLIARGEQRSGWTGRSVTVPVRSLPRTHRATELCIKVFTDGNETINVGGQLTSGALAAQSDGESLPGRLKVEYLHPGRSSWLSLVSKVARRMGLGRAWSGTWNVVLVALLMGAVALLSVRIVLRELR
jgi:hypothetical protein